MPVCMCGWVDGWAVLLLKAYGNPRGHIDLYKQDKIELSFGKTCVENGCCVLKKKTRIASIY